MPSVLASVVKALDAAQIPHMLTGSVAAAWHGAGRATLDVDLVVEARIDQVDPFITALSDHSLYVSDTAAREAIANESMFNVVDTATGWKVDLMVRKSRPFSHAEFARRRPIEVDGLQLHVASLEDLIVAKLEWAKLGGSARQLEDVATMVRVAGTGIAHDYLDHWIDELELQAQWHVVRDGHDTA
jgi:hypothetical protein